MWAAVSASQPGDGDIVSLKWAGDKMRSMCTLRLDGTGDLIPWPLDGSWSDETLVFDPSKDDWRWANDSDTTSAAPPSKKRGSSKPRSPSPTPSASVASAAPAVATNDKGAAQVMVGAACVALFALFLDPAMRTWLLEKVIIND